MKSPPGHGWAGINLYLGGMDCQRPCEGKPDKFKKAARSIELSIDILSERIGNHQRTLRIKN